MVERISYEAFNENVPEYVTRAHAAASKMVESALTEPSSNIQLGMEKFVLTSPSQPVFTQDRQEIRDHVKRRDYRTEVLHLDVPINGARLAVDSLHPFLSLGNGGIKAWLYMPPETEVRLNWLESEARADKSYLTSPYLYFRTVLPLHSQTNVMPRIYTYIHGSKLRGAVGIHNVNADVYKNALAPACTQLDQQLLDLSIETYHTRKIEGLLTIMENVV